MVKTTEEVNRFIYLVTDTAYGCDGDGTIKMICVTITKC